MWYCLDTLDNELPFFRRSIFARLFVDCRHPLLEPVHASKWFVRETINSTLLVSAAPVLMQKETNLRKRNFAINSVRRGKRFRVEPLKRTLLRLQPLVFSLNRCRP